MSQFELAEPRSVEEAVKLLDPSDESVRPIAGGTALMLMLKQKLFRPTRLVSLRSLNGDLQGISSKDAELRIGAMTPLRQLEQSVEVARQTPVVAAALKTLSNVRIRNVATVGGHLAHGDPHMDLPPILLSMGARVQAVSPRGSRWIPLGELYRGYYETTLERDELLTELALPVQAAGTYGTYLKFASLSADDWPTLGVALFFQLRNGLLEDVRVSISAATELPLRLTSVEELLTGERPTDALFAAAGDKAAASVNPLADIRGSAPYKREMVRVHVNQALQTALHAGPQRGE